jgi:hypothetical protein
MGAMLKNANVPSGGANGDLRFRVDLDHPERFSVAGKLGGGSMDLSWLLERPVTIDRVDMEADGGSPHTRGLGELGGAAFQVAGELARGGRRADHRCSSNRPACSDALLLRSGEKQAPAVEEKRPADEAVWKQWPLPVRGRIALRTDFIQYGERKAAPVAAVLVLEERRASLELQQVQLCGISLPLTAEATPEGLAIAARITAQKQQLEQTARCLSDQGVLISGDFDLSADLRTRGKLHELVPKLQGTVNAKLREGRVMKFALLGNILSFKGVSDAQGRRAKADGAGFPYRSLSASASREEDSSSTRAPSTAPQSGSRRQDGSLVSYDSRLGPRRAVRASGSPCAQCADPGLCLLAPDQHTGRRCPATSAIRSSCRSGRAPSPPELVGIFERTLKLPRELLPQKERRCAEGACPRTLTVGIDCPLSCR